MSNMRAKQKLVYAGKTPNEGQRHLGRAAYRRTRQADALDRETFGPVLHVVRYKAVDLPCSTRSLRPATA
jgi:RHH-type proline utilization regulon transcriptional repressor/proline dehydrogenase/delta 1-pyrroline-5-carboxylate dehydrogenase